MKGQKSNFAPLPGELGFTVVELLVAMAVLAMMTVMMAMAVSAAQRLAGQTASRVEQFREARRSFERINERLSQATLNAYMDYVDQNGQPRVTGPANTFTPYKYARISELRYMQTGAATSTIIPPPRGGTMAGQAVFFQAALGKSGASTLASMNSLMNTVGYFIERGSDVNDASLRPPTVSGTGKFAYRLFELTEPAENLTVYTLTSGSSTYNGNDWFLIPMAHKNGTVVDESHWLANNIVALLFQAAYPDASGNIQKTYLYNSAHPTGSTLQSTMENNLPPSIRISMIAVDESSARRIEDQNITLIDAQNDTDLDTLEGQLISHKLKYLRLESTVVMGPSK